MSAGVSVLALFASPCSTLEALKSYPGVRRPFFLTLAAVALLPVFIGIQFYSSLRFSFLSDPSSYINPEAAAFIIAATAGLLFFFGQAFLILIHYLMFMLCVKIFGTLTDGAVIKAVWWYALTPLMFRHIVYIMVLTLWGMPQLKNISVIAYLDPFIIWSTLLIYLGCRKTLGQNRKASCIITFLSSVIGLLVPLAQLVGAGLSET